MSEYRPRPAVRRAPRRGPGPVQFAVLGIVALLPALGLCGLWRWAGGQATVAAEGVPPVDPAAPPAPTPAAALNTGLLSLRRSAPALGRQLNVGAFVDAVQPLLGRVGAGSCAAISLDGRPVGEVNATTVVLPASTNKVLVAAAALDVLGPNFVYTTRVVGPRPEGGVITGDVYLVGGGDPLLSGDWYADSKLDANPAFNTTSLDELARRLVEAGVAEIRGTVRGDGSRYDDEWYVDSWGAGVAGVEAGPYDALLVNDSRVHGDDQRGSDPNASGAREFVRILAEQGVAVSGGAGTGTAPEGAAELASIESRRLPDVLAEMLTNSDNNTAELLLKEIGYQSTGEGTRQAGIDTVVATIGGWGVPTEGLVVADGSGLSLDDRVTCATMLGVLQHAGFDSAVGEGLAVAGETGTMAALFADTPLKGRLRGKTGTLGNPPFNADPPAVKALAGYLPVEGGGAIEFALILNGDPNGLPITEQDAYRPVWAELATALASYPAVAGVGALGPR